MAFPFSDAGIAFKLPNFTIHAASETSSNDFSYTIGDGGIIITGYTGSDTEIIIPDTIDERNVVTIGSQAFMGNSSLTSVTTAAPYSSSMSNRRRFSSPAVLFLPLMYPGFLHTTPLAAVFLSAAAQLLSGCIVSLIMV